MARKSILMLGGSRQQVVAIQSAKALGYRTVLCDYLPDNPGQHEADVFYQVSTTDPEAVLQIAERELVRGVLAYSSDPASPTAGYVAEHMGLPTNPLKAITTMSEKHLFRAFLRKAGLPCPGAVALAHPYERDVVFAAIEGLAYPIVVKPTDSSGSKGVTVARSASDVMPAVERAVSFSRNGILIAEEYIERSHPHVIGGDIFVVDGDIRFWGLMDCLRDDQLGGLVPVGKCLPPALDDETAHRVKHVLQRLVSALGVAFGEFNVEVIIGPGGTPYVLELGSRAGGNMIPVQLADASGIDLIAANVQCAMGVDPGELEWDSCAATQPIATYVLHSARDGVFAGVEKSDRARACVYREVLYQNPGDPVERFDGANKALGIEFLKFADVNEMDEVLADISGHIQSIVD